MPVQCSVNQEKQKTIEHDTYVDIEGTCERALDPLGCFQALFQ